jgi:galactokinase
MRAIKASTKIMKNLTPKQKQIEREYARMESVVASASKGQQSMRPRGSNGEYSQFQQECYAKYQSQIEAAQKRMRELKALAQEAI